MAPKDTQALTAGTCGLSPYMDVLKLRSWDEEIILGYVDWLNIIIRALKRQKKKVEESEKEMWRWKLRSEKKKKEIVEDAYY